ncbi:MAG: cbb3-type cytochrome c oxidase subunit I [Nitrospirales bacterium]|nr:cbb3-type cytochrome c oxidase subunit I [Nitrospirales bacterium]QOJ35423.1 MAG: cbb3-type cytochrome c oxidase subunit I [Nitrospira sp.]
MDTTDPSAKSLVQAWARWALVWLTFFPLVGVLVSIQFHNPEFLGGISWFTFGRLRPVHTNGVIFGSFTTAFIALLYYFLPRLCGTPLYKAEWGWGLLWLWNAFLVLGSLSLLMGYVIGVENAEFEWPLNILRYVVFVGLTIQVLGTIFRRRAARFYVSLWYALAAAIWTLLNLLIGNVLLPYGPLAGANNAAMHGLYIHYVVGLWMTPAGLATIYYFLPLAAKNALYSHKLSLLGFWTLALFYPLVGTHHYLYSPIPHWTQTVSIVHSMWMIIPVVTVIVNFFGTMLGRWGTVLGGGGGDNYAAKFLMIGVFYYLVGSVQGSIESLYRFQQLTHFNDFVIGHAHLTVFGAMILWVVGGLYYVWPRLVGRQLWSDRLASWHLWLTVTGFSAMILGLTAQGFIQGSMLEHGADFVDSVKVMQPWWVARTVVGTMMDLALGLMAYNFYKTIGQGEPIETELAVPMQRHSQPIAMVPGRSWLENPSTVGILAGIGFFSVAVFILGIIPWLQPASRVTTVVDVVTDLTVRVEDYTPLEQRGRQVYIRDGCWHCHSQYIRPVTGESLRWGPVSQIGESAYDVPHLFSTRRIGPDLTRVGRKYGDDWHVAHLWNPADVVYDSIMPRFPWLFDTGGKEGPPQLNEEGLALVAYLQRLGTAIGDWRAGSPSTRMSGAASLPGSPQAREEVLSLGKEVYARRCAGCHGAKGDGKGPSAVFLHPKPRDFTTGVFKFRSTAGKDSLPTDADLYLTLTHGLWGTSMPSMQEIPDRQRGAVVQYLKTFSDRWRKESVGIPISIPSEVPLTVASIERGKVLFQMNCVLCHGEQGQADGPLAGPGMLMDDWGEPIRPAHLSLPAGMPGGVKLGHDGPHLFQTIVGGIGGTPMPPFDGLKAEEVWDLVHYVQSLRAMAHEAELVTAGLQEQDRQRARERIWSAISGRAEVRTPMMASGPAQ